MNHNYKYENMPEEDRNALIPAITRTTQKKELNIDFRITNEGTIILFTPLTEAAKAFLERCDTEPWQWLGPSLAVDHRPARDLLEIIRSEGLEVT